MTGIERPSTDVLVIGGTGRVGSAVVGELAARGVQASIAGRSGPVVIDHDDPDSYEALAGVSTLFVAVPDRPDGAEVERRLYQAAVRQRVARVVKLSAASAGWSPPSSFGSVHAEAEVVLENSGLEWTVLRPTVFQETIGLFTADLAKGRLVTPRCRAPIAFVTVADVAAVGAEAVIDPSLVGRSLELTGPRAVTFAEVAELASRSVGRNVAHRNLPHWPARRVLPRVAGMSRWMADQVVDLFVGLDRGLQSTVGDDVAQVLGRPATDIELVLPELLDGPAAG